MKVKDLPEHTDLNNLVLLVPDSLVKHHDLPCNKMCVASTWHLGVWLKMPGQTGRIYPVTPYGPSDILEWECA